MTLKWIQIWSNPWLPAAFQAPRAFLLAGPVSWILKTALLANLAREHNPAITWPDDPLDLENWLGGWIDTRNWHMAVNPNSFMADLESGVVWGVLTSRWATWHDMAHVMLEDAELSVRCDRWLDGDPEPWPGYRPRNGQLIIDIVDKSGVYVGTSHGGSIFSGLERTVVEFSDDFIDSTISLAEDTETPQDYFLPGNKYTDKALPYVVFREGETSPIQTSQWINSPAKGVQVNVGGHSMPGVNECLAGDTLIDGPDGPQRIDALAASGEPFRVWSLTPEGYRVAATASFAFRKGYAELFTYTMDDGRSITVTKDHRFLTPAGFTRAGALQAGNEISVVDWAQDPSDEPARKVADTDYIGVDTPTRVITGIEPAGWDYFYDMTVPGWENYSAAGIWNHNTISATVQAVGDIVGNIAMIGGLGGSLDTMLKPMYEDTVLAWMSVKSSQRAENAGWERLFEYFQQGAQQAYTVAALIVLRAGFWATKTTTSWKVQVADGMPYLIGDRGKGHFFLDDRVGLVLKGDTEIHMDRCRKLDLAWDEQSPPEWAITIGDDRVLQDPAQRAFGKIEQLVAGLRDLGVW